MLKLKTWVDLYLKGRFMISSISNTCNNAETISMVKLSQLKDNLTVRRNAFVDMELERYMGEDSYYDNVDFQPMLKACTLYLATFDPSDRRESETSDQFIKRYMEYGQAVRVAEQCLSNIIEWAFYVALPKNMLANFVSKMVNTTEVKLTESIRADDIDNISSSMLMNLPLADEIERTVIRFGE